MEPVIKTEHLSKNYRLYNRPLDRLGEMILRRPLHRVHRALHDVSFTVDCGEVLGIIGRNGAGKSTLLQLICGTLRPSSGTIAVSGRIAALLELGAGFNPEFTGRENVYLNGAILGLSSAEISARFDEIAAFAGIGDFIEQPVKTYSSGMFVRLAFAVAVNVEPDILVIDEALAVGDGVFARKSFDKIMSLKDAGKTILFCSHSMYQVEALCSKAIWIEQGEVRAYGDAQDVVKSYNTFLERMSHAAEPVVPDRVRLAPETETETETETEAGTVKAVQPAVIESGRAVPYLKSVQVAVDGSTALPLVVESCISDVEIAIGYSGGTQLPAPMVAIVIRTEDGRIVTSTGVVTKRTEVVAADGDEGKCVATVTFKRFPLLKGDYLIDVYLLCERGILEYDSVMGAARIQVKQEGLALGLVELDHSWDVGQTT